MGAVEQLVCNDDDSEVEDEQLVCNTTGERWDDLQCPVIIDSGACAPVMPTEWRPHVEVTRTPRSIARGFFRASHGHSIYNEGQKLVTMTIREGAK